MVIGNDSIKEIREEFRKYLEKEYSHIKNKNVILSDAFYLLRHNIGISFRDALRDERSLELCREKLEDYFKDVRRMKSPKNNSYTYMVSIKILKEFLDIKYGGVPEDVATSMNSSIKKDSDSSFKKKKSISMESKIIPTPCEIEVIKYLNKWNDLENYSLQENALEKLFHKTYPNNREIEDVLIKVSTLNDFYSTNIFSPFTIAKHIIRLQIDDRLESNDLSLVNDIAKVKMDSGNIINFYSFATKYCSHHKPNDYPIYDSYVDKILRYFRDKDNFTNFKSSDLKEFSKFKKILIEFRTFYGLEEYSLKEIDKYLWQLGKEKFPRKF